MSGLISFPWKKRLAQDMAAARKYSAQLAEWDVRQTGDVQLRALQTVWDDCITDVPYYHNLVLRGQAPAAIATWDDFRAIPELTRDILQKQPAEFRRLSGPPDLIRATGGSTGTPAKFGVWKTEDQILRMLKLVLWQKVGYTPDARLYLIWGHAHLLGTGWRRYLNHAIRKTKDCLAGYRRADAYRLSPDHCQKIASDLLAFKPVGLIGYAAALDYFVRATETFHDRFRKLGIRFVMPAAEPAPRPDTYSLMRDVFRAPIVQEFGGVDFGQVGMKVDDEPFKVFPDKNLLEAIPSKGQPADTGDALVTTLYRRYVPMIRYRQGDVLQGVQRLEHGHVQSFAELAGRTNDMLDMPSGAVIHSVAFLHCIHQEPAVLNGQLLIDDSGATLSLVVRHDFDTGSEMRIRHRLVQLDSSLAKLPIQQVLDLETSIAGKRRWFVDKRTPRQK